MKKKDATKYHIHTTLKRVQRIKDKKAVAITYISKCKSGLRLEILIMETHTLGFILHLQVHKYKSQKSPKMLD